MNEIEELLRERIGLEAASVGSSTIQRTVRLRMKGLGLKRAEEYRRLLQTSQTEWTALVEAVVVTETWFFRDQAPFAALVHLAQSAWLPDHPSRPLRVLSLPCSSGEEPYSLAMALLDAGVPAERFRIDAVDISSRALAKARRGVYNRNSFRGQDLSFRNRWFQSVSGGFSLSPTVRRCVRFAQANVLEPDFLADQAPYDFIFCRNLLIYLGADARRKALEKIQRLLSPSGVLFVGAAEQPLVLDHGFVSANLPLAFACRQAAAGATHVGPQHPARSFQLSTSHPPADSELERARRLADAGQLKEAAAVCEAHLKQQPASAPGWYLLGLVREAAGEPAAHDCYRKALYLEPNHYESLLQLALLAEKNGDAARARTYKRRAQRSQPQGPAAAA